MLLVPSSQHFTLSRSHIAELAIQQRMPTMFIFKPYVEAGGLISYSVDPPAMYRQVGFYVAKILNGAKPADLPIQQPVKFELVINLKTAAAFSYRGYRIGALGGGLPPRIEAAGYFAPRLTWTSLLS